MSLVVAAYLTLALGVREPPPVAYSSFIYGRHLYHAVTVEVASGRVSASVVSSPRLTSVWRMVRSSQPIVAVTGTFFDRRSQRPVADVLVDGNLRGRGSRGSAIGVDWFGAVRIFDRPFRRDVAWDDYRFGLRGAVRVVADGKVRPNPRAQRFRDRSIWGSAARTGLGLTREGKVLIFATRHKVTLSEFGKAMRSRGAVDAVSLDGGGSTCLYYKGSLVIHPGRKLNNLFVVCWNRRTTTANLDDFEPLVEEGDPDLDILVPDAKSGHPPVTRRSRSEPGR